MNKKIAIPIEDGMLCAHFGHCEYFYVAIWSIMKLSKKR